MGQTWSIIKISYNPSNGHAVGGICGTAFFIRKHLFISAHHCLNNSVFIPNTGFSKVKVFLADESGRMLDASLVKSIPEYDLTVGKTRKDVDVLPVATDFKIGDAVYNVGFPVTESLVSMPLSITNGNLTVQKVVVKSFRQDGVIEGVPVVDTSNAADVKVNIPMIKLSYTSRTGFSGGPLISGGKVIGMMSFVVPKENDPKRPVMAVRMADILGHYYK